MIATMSDNIDNFEAVDAMPPFPLFPWFFVIPGCTRRRLAVIALRRSPSPNWQRGQTHEAHTLTPHD